MSEIIHKVFSVFGNDIPKERHNYSATEKSPIPMREIKKKFGSYENFLKEYNAYCIQKRNDEAKKAVVTKGDKTGGKPNASK